MLLLFRIGQTSEIEKVFIKYNFNQTDDFLFKCCGQSTELKKFLVKSKLKAIFHLLVGSLLGHRD